MFEYVTMRWPVASISVLTLMLFFSVGTPTADAASCSAYSSQLAVPTGFGASYNIFTAEKELQLDSASCDSSGFRPSMSAANTTQDVFAVYQTMYVWNGAGWEAATVVPDGGRTVGSYVFGSAASLENILHKGNTTYWVAYTCNKVNSSWRCGCQDASCITSKWNLQAAKKPTGTSTKDFSGIFALLSGQTSIAASQVDVIEGRQAYIDGVTARASWQDLEPTPGTYDFSVFTNVLTRMQAYDSEALMNIEIFSSDSPDHVTAAATQTWFVPATRSSGGGLQEEPIPWDEGALASWEALFEALSNHRVADVNNGSQLTALKDHSGVGSILAAIPGLGMIRDRSYVNADATPIWEQPGYSRQNLLTAIDRSIKAATQKFANNNVDIGFFAINDGSSPRLDEYIVDFMKANHPEVGGFMENLKGSTPAYSTSLPIVQLYEESSATTRPKNWLQACGIWATGGICTFAADDNNPMDGIRHAVDNLYTDIVELYITDIETFGAQLTEVHDYLKQQSAQ